MKLTKSQLKEIIREELSKFNGISSIFENWILNEDDETVTNPRTGRKIKVSTALSYPRSHPAHRAVMQAKQDKEDEERRAQSQKKGKDVVSTLRKSSKSGNISSQEKTDKIINKLTKTYQGNNYKSLDWDAIENMSPENKEKLAKLANTRVKLYDKLNQVRDNVGDEIYSIQGNNNTPKAVDRDDDGNVIYKMEETGTTFTKEESERYYKEKSKFEKDMNLGDASTAAFNVKWTEENPDKPTISKKKMDKVKPFLKKIDDLDKKINPMADSYRAMKDLRDHFATNNESYNYKRRSSSRLTSILR
jgi:hypothetical protein